jgi:hypothetical protein
MPQLGTDCDILLYHQAIQSGEPQGFLLDRSRLSRGSVSVFRSAYKQADGSFQDNQVITFTVLVGEGLVQPDGALLQESSSQQYFRLFDLLQRRSEIGVITPEGVFSGLDSSGSYALEERARGVNRVTIQLSSDGNIFAPADRDLFEQSVWSGDGYSGSMTWENSYWRA